MLITILYPFPVSKLYSKPLPNQRKISSEEYNLGFHIIFFGNRISSVRAMVSEKDSTEKFSVFS